MRNLFRKLKQDASNLLQHQDVISEGDKHASNAELIRKQSLVGGVGDIEDAGEFGLGKAPLEAKPVHKIEVSKEREAEIAMMNEYSEQAEENFELI
jgi:hypothetical protein